MNNFVLFDDISLLEYIELLKERNDILIDKLYTILSNLGYDNQTISTILYEDISSSLQLIIDKLNNVI